MGGEGAVPVPVAVAVAVPVAVAAVHSACFPVTVSSPLLVVVAVVVLAAVPDAVHTGSIHPCCVVAVVVAIHPCCVAVAVVVVVANACTMAHDHLSAAGVCMSCRMDRQMRMSYITRGGDGTRERERERERETNAADIEHTMRQRARYPIRACVALLLLAHMHGVQTSVATRELSAVVMHSAHICRGVHRHSTIGAADISGMLCHAMRAHRRRSLSRDRLRDRLRSSYRELCRSRSREEERRRRLRSRDVERERERVRRSDERRERSGERRDDVSVGVGAINASVCGSRSAASAAASSSSSSSSRALKHRNET